MNYTFRLKSTLLTLLALIALLFAAFGQEESSNETPAEIIAAFDDKFTSAIKTSWEKTDEGHKVKFTQRSEEKWAIFDDSGNCIQHNTIVANLRLPGPVIAAIKRQFPEYKVRHVEKVKMANNNTLYDVEIEKEKKKNRDAYYLQLSTKGTLLKNEPIDVEAKR